AVIALPAGNEVASFGLAGLDEILARHLQRSCDSLRAARYEIDVTDALRRLCNQRVGERFGDLGGEEAGVRVRQAVDLPVHCGADVRMPMPEAGHGRAARCVDVAAALGVVQPDALPARGDRKAFVEDSMDDASHHLLAR